MNFISITNLSKSFKKKKILENVNFYADKGKIIGIIGPSGAGKSVFMKMLIKFLKPNSGRIIINSLTKNPIGFSMQNNSLYDNLSIKQNLNYFAKINNVPRKMRKNRIPYLIKQLNLEEYKKTLARDLSGGTKKRLDIACALLNDPEILILDEPFLGLDPALVNNLSKFILLLKKHGKTIIISSHRTIELSAICNKLFLIKNKKIYAINKSQINKAYE